MKIENIVAVTSWFAKKSQTESETGDLELDDADRLLPAENFPTPYVAPPKIGRNEPCPCGSGKKYKKCCGG